MTREKHPLSGTIDRQIFRISIGWVCKEDMNMELGKRLKDLRNRMGMTQDELAERLFVSRQTISSWENDKSYPDIHSLLMISELFSVSLDTLVKGDIEVMKEKIDQETIRTFKKNSNIYAALLLICLVSFVPLYKWLSWWGLAIWIPFFALAIFFCIRLEKIKKEQDIHSYKEIVAFVNGEKLDDISKAREEGKRSYQKVIAFLAAALFTALVLWIISLIV